jgi:hypothetical protein
VNGAAVVNLIRRRGNIVAWQHAVPASGYDVDAASRSLRLPAGGPRVVTGPDGETYGPSYLVRAYVSKKISAAIMQTYGVQDSRDSQVDVVGTFQPEPANGIVLPDTETLAAYNAGNFCAYPQNAPQAVSLELIARDRFIINGLTYVVKAAAIPIQDSNVTVAWRILVGATTF